MPRQQQFFLTPRDLRDRNFQLRIECYRAFLASHRDTPDPTPAEISLGRSLTPVSPQQVAS